MARVILFFPGVVYKTIFMTDIQLQAYDWMRGDWIHFIIERQSFACCWRHHHLLKIFLANSIEAEIEKERNQATFCITSCFSLWVSLLNDDKKKIKTNCFIISHQSMLYSWMLCFNFIVNENFEGNFWHEFFLLLFVDHPLTVVLFCDNQYFFRKKTWFRSKGADEGFVLIFEASSNLVVVWWGLRIKLTMNELKVKCLVIVIKTLEGEETFRAQTQYLHWYITKKSASDLFHWNKVSSIFDDSIGVKFDDKLIRRELVCTWFTMDGERMSLMDKRKNEKDTHESLTEQVFHRLSRRFRTARSPLNIACQHLLPPETRYWIWLQEHRLWSEPSLLCNDSLSRARISLDHCILGTGCQMILHWRLWFRKMVLLLEQQLAWTLKMLLSSVWYLCRHWD